MANGQAPHRDGISIANATNAFDADDQQVVALEDLYLCFADPESLCIVGPSGSGKTTLLLGPDHASYLPLALQRSLGDG